VLEELNKKAEEKNNGNQKPQNQRAEARINSVPKKLI